MERITRSNLNLGQWLRKIKKEKSTECPQCRNKLRMNIYGETTCFSCGWIDEKTLAPEHVRR